jgi:pimeloyl-ACP methyl ester carboxylesterase
MLKRGVNYAQRHRGAISDAAYPFAGDILLYQGRGDQIRGVIREAIHRAVPPVVLLAHSLGGIASVDLLALEPLPVDLLITVGSQAPFLYEINALHSLAYGDPLPPHYPPRWLNIYDLRDLLSYRGEGLFPGRVTDVKVDNRQPFPDSHSAYWTNAQVWDTIVARLP